MATVSPCSRLPRSTIRSQVTRPEQSSRVSTLRGVGRLVADEGAERRVAGEVLGLRGGLLALEHRLGREDDQRAVLLAERVTAEQVEVRRRGRGLRDDHRVLGRHGEEALDAGRAVVGTLALVAVGEEQHDAGLLAPLELARGDELVDDGLGAVDEVAELGLPEDERVGTGHGVAVLEAERGVLGEQRVVDVELRLVLGEVGQRRPLVGVGAVDDRREALARTCRGASPGRRAGPGGRP